MSDVVIPFPDKAGRNLRTDPKSGYAAITRKVERIIQDHDPEPQAAKLTVRAAALASMHFMTRREVAASLRVLADELENMR